MNYFKNLKSVALAGVLGVLSAGQSAEAVFVFDIVDSDTFTVTAQGSSMTQFGPGPNGAAWGTNAGTLSTGALASSNGAVGSGPGGVAPLAPGQVRSGVYVDGGALAGVHLEGFFSNAAIPDGGVYTVSGVTGVDLQTLTLPSSPLPADTSIITIVTSSSAGELTFVPEPSSAAILALGGCVLMLRRRRA